jgi:hypothetical protein
MVKGAAMKTRILFATVALVTFCGVASAQTVSWSLGWDQPGMALVDVQGAVYTLTIDGGPVAVLTPTCTQPSVTTVTCSAPLGALTTGSHTLVLAIQSGGGTASVTLVTKPPSTPLNPRIVIKISVP